MSHSLGFPRGKPGSLSPFSRKAGGPSLKAGLESKVLQERKVTCSPRNAVWLMFRVLSAQGLRVWPLSSQVLPVQALPGPAGSKAVAGPKSPPAGKYFRENLLPTTLIPDV